MLAILGWGLATVFFVCFIYVVVKMLEYKQRILAVATIIATTFLGLGLLIAFIVGWVKVRAWKLRPTMIVWTIAVVTYVVWGFIQPSVFTEILHRVRDIISAASD